MEEENRLTKKERRALAKEKKQGERQTEQRKGWLLKLAAAAVIVIVVVLGIRYLNTPSAPTGKLQDKFVEYATELQLDTEQFKSDLETVDDAINTDIASANQVPVTATPTFVLNGEVLQNISGGNFREQIEQIMAVGDGTPTAIGEGEWMKGNTDAKYVLVEYGDFQCPACASFYPIVKQVASDHQDDLLVVYREFPLVNIHPNAYPAAQAAEAAGKQGKFWEMHDLLYERQSEWSTIR